MNSEKRMEVIDFCRSISIIAMIIYHFAYDLGQFGFIDLNNVMKGPWKIFAILIGTSFLFISGFSFWIMIKERFNKNSYIKRLIILSSSSFIITIVTYFYLGNSFIFFGILHLLATCSLLGLIIFKLPYFILIFLSIIFFILPQFYQSDFFEPKYLAWIGFYGKSTGSADFYPLLPWSSSFIMGIAISKIISKKKYFENLNKIENKNNFIKNSLLWSGRNSLLIYLIHQPILVGLIYLYILIF